jgi:hypothetical protein
MSHKALVAVGVLALVSSLSGLHPVLAQGNAPLICVAFARSEVGVDLSTPLRDSLVAGLKAVNANASAVDSGDDMGSIMESTQKGCSFLVFTRVQKGGGGLMGHMSNLRPKASTPDISAGAAANVAPAPAGATLADVERTFVKRGDSFSVEYRLMPGNIPRPIKSGKVDGKAQADGDDVLGPLVGQLSSTIARAAANAPPDTHATPATPSESASTNASTKSQRGRGNQPPPNGGLPPNMDCEQMAASSRGVITVESCKQLMAAQQTYTNAVNDPRASKPGDDTMTCDQIATEIKQQPFTPPDAAKTTEMQAAVKDQQDTIKKQSREAAQLQAKESAEMVAASRLAWVSNYLAAKAEEKILQEQKAAGELMAKESAPKAQRSITATADMVADFSKQLSENPRLAKLVFMADQKRCTLR